MYFYNHSLTCFNHLLVKPKSSLCEYRSGITPLFFTLLLANIATDDDDECDHFGCWYRRPQTYGAQ